MRHSSRENSKHPGRSSVAVIVGGMVPKKYQSRSFNIGEGISPSSQRFTVDGCTSKALDISALTPRSEQASASRERMVISFVTRAV